MPVSFSLVAFVAFVDFGRTLILNTAKIAHFIAKFGLPPRVPVKEIATKVVQRS